jgi:hypothetical protein
MSKTNLKTENRKNTTKNTFSMLNSFFTAFKAFFSSFYCFRSLLLFCRAARQVGGGFRYNVNLKTLFEDRIFFLIFKDLM